MLELRHSKNGSNRFNDCPCVALFVFHARPIMRRAGTECDGSLTG